ncbi:MAG: prephenate dehydrogenase [Verrucomicrobiia bacterium]
MQRWEKIAIIGVGLLGGSIGLAVKKTQVAKRVEGYVRREESISKCESIGAVDKASCNLKEVVSGADLIILCTPLAQMKALVEKMESFIQRDSVVTDVGSAKAKVVKELEPLIANMGAHFVGSHPMAGSEKTGVDAAKPNLFIGSICVITPTNNSNENAVKKIAEFWKELGGRVLKISPELHDELVSRSSHLPHIIAAELARYVLNPEYPKEQALLCSSGFRDTTRIASSSPEMWRDIVLANRTQLSTVLEEFLNGLIKFKELLDKEDAEKIEQFFKNAKKLRDDWIEQGHSPE